MKAHKRISYLDEQYEYFTHHHTLKVTRGQHNGTFVIEDSARFELLSTILDTEMSIAVIIKKLDVYLNHSMLSEVEAFDLYKSML